MPQSAATVRRRFRSTQARAARKGYVFDLTLEQFANFLSYGCAYCGGEATGLDRLNPRGGYQLGEVLPACGNCNALRGRIHWVPWAKMLNRFYRMGGPQYLLPESLNGARTVSRIYGSIYHDGFGKLRVSEP